MNFLRKFVTHPTRTAVRAFERQSIPLGTNNALFLSVTATTAAAACLALTWTNQHTHCQQEGEEDVEQKERFLNSLLQKQTLSNKKPIEISVPEEYSETSSPLCRKYRQGPCAEMWRKLEYCAEKMQNKDDGSCDGFITPFKECLRENENLYRLVELDVDQIQVRNMELEYRYDEKGTIEPKMDWKNWLQFLKEEGSLQKALDDIGTDWKSLDKFVPTWKRFVILEKKPFIVHVKGLVPLRHEDKTLKAVYALDQDGLVAGYTEYDKNKIVGSGHVLDITLVPGMTKTIQMKALYGQNSGTHPGKRSWEMEYILCTGPEVSLEKVASTVVPLQEPKPKAK